eukprot:TRINITY_DN13860_c0_g1_i1.p1 TRINITY_DN13860_c0_g1~~TRINITY_DN13860_c0_g1_i1.p1  ORF type:complete len:206 (+),score=46.26 TRINITY_DN13860_c0_g1_i1:30-620(+)
MARGKKVRRTAKVARIRKTDKNVSETNKVNPNKQRVDESESRELRQVFEMPTHMFFEHNMALGPPYRVLVDTNFINHSISNHLTIDEAMMDCLYAKCIPIVTDCVIAELEKLGKKYRPALRMAKSRMFQRLTCTHSGTYADDCICRHVTQHPIYIVATHDKDLQRRIRKIPGVPIMSIKSHKYYIERLPEDYGAPK